MRIVVNGEEKHMAYEDICHELGITPETKMVHVTRSGAIGWTMATPDELKRLYNKVKETGMKMSRALKEIKDENGYWRI